MSTRRPSSPTLKEIKQQLDDLKAKVESAQLSAGPSRYWWRDHAGRFENDPMFDEMLRLARQERKRQVVKKRGTKKRGTKRARS